MLSSSALKWCLLAVVLGIITTAYSYVAPEESPNPFLSNEQKELAELERTLEKEKALLSTALERMKEMGCSSVPEEGTQCAVYYEVGAKATSWIRQTTLQIEAVKIRMEETPPL